MSTNQLPDNHPHRFLDIVEAIYQDKFCVHPYCDVYWKFKGRWIQILLIAPLFDGEALYKAIGWDGEVIEKYVLHRDWWCTVLWYGD